MTCHKVKFGKSNWALFLQLHSLLPLESALATESTNPPPGLMFAQGLPDLEAAGAVGNANQLNSTVQVKSQ